MSVLTIPDLMDGVQYGGEVTWHDLFCGGGGSSLGLHHVPGFKVTAALNHWDLAVQAHATNFPETDHEVTLIQDVHPSRFARARCGWFSPSCTHHAYCRGSKDLDDEGQRSRATMWDVCRWTEFHRYDVVVVENVIEVKLWCDNHAVDVRTGKPGCSCGSTYDLWVQNMTSMGMTLQEVYFNSQHALVPQSRDRLYMVFSRDGVPLPDLDLRPPAYCSGCEQAVAGVQTFKRPSRGSARDNPRLHRWGRYGKNYVYTCPICDLPAAPAVVGAEHIIDDDIPIATIGSRKRAIAAATRERIRTGIKRIGDYQPIQLQVGGNLFERPGYARVWSLRDPIRTITTTPYMAMVTPAGSQEAYPKPVTEPTHTLTTSDRLAVVIPNKTNNVGRSIEEPVGAITTAPAGHMLVAMRSGMDGQPDGLPTPTAATRSDQAIVSLRNHGMAVEVGEPLSTINAGGHHHGLLVYNGTPGFVRALTDAAGTITSRDKQSLLVPYSRTSLPQPLGEPAATITSRGRNGVLEVTDEDIDEMLFRMLKWPELQRGQAMHVLPDGEPYMLTARVPTRNGKYKDLTDEQRVKMIGNAVSSPVAAMLGHSIAAALAVAA